MGWYGLKGIDGGSGWLVAPPVSIKDRSLFGHAFSHWKYQSHTGIMGTGKPMYLFIPKGLNRY